MMKEIERSLSLDQEAIMHIGVYMIACMYVWHGSAEEGKQVGSPRCSESIAHLYEMLPCTFAMNLHNALLLLQ